MDKENEMNKKIGRIAHLYALMAWSDKYTLDEAKEFIKSTPYEDLDKTTGAETSIIAALNGFEGIRSILTDAGVSKEEKWGAVIDVLQSIHDKWVFENAGKYDRGREDKSLKKLFQHLPTALIGLDEVASDLLFLAPFLSENELLDAGEMQLESYGAFKPSREFAEAYAKYADDYLKANNVESKTDLESHIKDCINGAYESLTADTDVASNRRDYMNNNVKVLLDSVSSKYAGKNLVTDGRDTL